MHELLKAGKSVIATTRNREALQTKLNGTYDVETLNRLLVVGLDVTKVDDIKAAFAKGIDKFGRIDVVVNNAAFVSLIIKEKSCIKSHSNQSVLGEVEVIPIEDAREQFEVLFWAPVNISKEVSGGPLLRIY